MAYIRLSGTDGAFGWMMGERMTLGALKGKNTYLLLGDTGEFAVTCDTQGAWQGTPDCGVPLVLLHQDSGSMALYNEERLTYAAAILLAQERMNQKKAKAAPAQEALVQQAVPEPAQEAAEPEKITYRVPSDAKNVDALPELVWPDGAEKLRPLFVKNRPIRLFDEPGWRFVQTQEAGMKCCFGYRAAEDRVAEVLYGVQARGGLTAPKSLQGYQYKRALQGEGYWTLRQRV